jgi:hypothetical protein
LSRQLDGLNRPLFKGLLIGVLEFVDHMGILLNVVNRISFDTIVQVVPGYNTPHGVFMGYASEISRVRIIMIERKITIRGW